MSISARRLALAAILVFAALPPAEATNAIITTPIPKGTTVELSLDAPPSVDTEGRLRAQLMYKGKPFPISGVLIEFDLVDGKARMNTHHKTSDDGAATVPVIPETPGRLVIEASCRTDGCATRLELNVAPKGE